MTEDELELFGILGALEGLPVLNLEMVGELRDIAPPDEPQFLTELFAEFERDALAQLEAMHVALSQGDAIMLGRAAHKIKGMSGTLGAARVSRVAAMIQERANCGELKHAPKLVSRLQNEFEAARDALQTEAAD